MIKQLMYVGGIVAYRTENEEHDAVDYVDNIEKRFIVRNGIEYLRKRIKEDNFNWKFKEESRVDNLKTYKVCAVVANATVTVLPIIASISSCINAGTNDINSIFQELKNNLGMYAYGFPLGNLFSLIPLSTRPTLSVIAGYEEMCKYEEELLERKEKELEELEKDDTRTGWPDVNGKNVNGKYFKVVNLDDSKEIKDIDDALKLRYYFGSEKDKVYKCLEEDFLFESLVEHGFSEEVINDFFAYVKQEHAKNKESLAVLSKKNY